MDLGLELRIPIRGQYILVKFPNLLRGFHITIEICSFQNFAVTRQILEYRVLEGEVPCT